MRMAHIIPDAIDIRMKDYFYRKSGLFSCIDTFGRMDHISRVYVEIFIKTILQKIEETEIYGSVFECMF